jgi:hypothetical protein
MHITWKHPGNPDKTWEFDPLTDVSASAAELIERRFGGTYDQWRNGVRAGSVKARRILLWHLLRAGNHHTLKYEDTPDFRVGDFTVEMNVKELTELRERLLKVKMDEDEREQTLTALDIEMTEAMERETDPDQPEDAGRESPGKL